MKKMKQRNNSNEKTYVKKTIYSKQIWQTRKHDKTDLQAIEFDQTQNKCGEDKHVCKHPTLPLTWKSDLREQCTNYQTNDIKLISCFTDRTRRLIKLIATTNYIQNILFTQPGIKLTVRSFTWICCIVKDQKKTGT